MPPTPRQPTVTVVIPVLNEEHNLPLILENLPEVDEIVVVDGRSQDDTVAVAREVRPDVVVVRQTRSGKGNALVCGFAASSGDIVVTLNGDGSTDPGEIPRFVDALLSGAEVAHGSRFRAGGEHRDAGALERFGHALLCRVVNAFFGTRFTDLSCGYNAYWRDLTPALQLPPTDLPRLKRGRLTWGDGPEIDTLATIRMAAQGLRVVEVATVGYPPLDDRARRLLPAALRALRTAYTEYVRRWRIGHRPVGPAGQRHVAPESRPAEHEDTPAGRHAARHSVPPPTRARVDRGRRRRDRRERRPDLTVIRGEGRDDREWDDDGPARLRAVGDD